MFTITPAIIQPAADEALSEGDFAGLLGLSFYIRGDVHISLNIKRQAYEPRGSLIVHALGDFMLIFKLLHQVPFLAITKLQGSILPV